MKGRIEDGADVIALERVDVVMKDGVVFKRDGLVLGRRAAGIR